MIKILVTVQFQFEQDVPGSDQLREAQLIFSILFNSEKLEITLMWTFKFESAKNINLIKILNKALEDARGYLLVFRIFRMILI